MGGCIFLGIRRKDGSEHLMDVWTNPLPWDLPQEEFLNDGRIIDKYLVEVAKPGKRWTYVLEEEINPSEYGTILVDFVTNKMISVNGYFALGDVNFSVPRGEIDDRDRVRVEGWFRDGRIKKVEDWGAFASPSELGINSPIFEDLRDAVLTGRKARRSGPYRLSLDLSPFEVNQELERSSKSEWWPKILSFLEENGWKSKAWTVDRVWEEYDKELEEGFP